MGHHCCEGSQAAPFVTTGKEKAVAVAIVTVGADAREHVGQLRPIALVDTPATATPQ